MGDEAIKQALDEVITTIIKHAVAAPAGHLKLANAKSFIMGELERNRFNTERAVEVYTFAIDNSVWALVKDKGNKGRDYRRSGLGKKFAIELTDEFKRGFRYAPIKDQRPPRRFLRFLLGA
jgi:hypothetical protein